MSLSSISLTYEGSLNDVLSLLKVALKVTHKIKNRKSAMQVEIDKLAEQYGVPTSELRMQIQGV